jgi:hypothetical protein
MIASQKIGKSFMGALGYNLRKVNHPDINQRAKLLDTNIEVNTLAEVKKEIDLLRELRPNLSRYVYHTSLNFPSEDEALLRNETLLAIAHDYLEANGFDNNQYLIFRHYDAGHPHLHLLVNRIRFDGSVVSDSNNYKKSEDILRRLEIKYQLTTVAPSKEVKLRAAKKDEIEMAIRTGKPSEKMLLQEKLKQITSQKQINLQGLIKQGEAHGIHFLFNQATTGRITGITYYHEGFKIKGKVLGNQFKWSELVKKLNYEQVRDSKAVSEENSRTRGIYGDLTTGTAGSRDYTSRGIGLHTGGAEGTGYFDRQSATTDADGAESQPNRTRSLETDQDADILANDAPDFDYNRFDGIGIEIADDEDDAKYRRRSRWMGR